jgi:hypothetical protein
MVYERSERDYKIVKEFQMKSRGVSGGLGKSLGSSSSIVSVVLLIDESGLSGPEIDQGRRKIREGNQEKSRERDQGRKLPSLSQAVLRVGHRLGHHV